MKEKKKQSPLGVLMGYAGAYRKLTYLGLALSAVAMVLGMAPYICIWLAARDLISVAPEWTRAAGAARYGWMHSDSLLPGSRLLKGRTVLVITHRMRAVEAADKVVVLADGKVVETGRPEALRARENGIFRHMTELQASSAPWRL